MVVLSNSTPLIYLAKMGELDLLRKLFSEVFVSGVLKKAREKAFGINEQVFNRLKRRGTSSHSKSSGQ